MTTADAITICQWLEKRLRPLGYHVGLTGSCLYGMGKSKEPKDVDVIIYPASDTKTLIPPGELLAKVGITNAEDCNQMPLRDYPEGEEPTHPRRTIWRAIKSDGHKVDFFFL
jgi:hypothetical protein